MSSPAAPATAGTAGHWSMPSTGWLTGPVDTVLDAMKMPDWGRQLFWALVMAVIAFQLLKLLVRRVLSASAPAVAAGVRRLTEACGLAVLLGEYAFTLLLRAFKLRIPGAVYLVGDGVQRGTVAASAYLGDRVRSLRHLSRTPRWVLVVGLVAAFALWDQTYCGSGDAACHSPTAQWQSSFKAWKDSKDAPDVTPAATPSGRPTQHAGKPAAKKPAARKPAAAKKKHSG
jgi:hypothetical protein